MLSHIFGQPSAPSTNIIVAGCGKVFVGEIVELSREVMNERDETGPILPHHIQEAHQRYQKLHPNLNSRVYRRKLF